MTKKELLQCASERVLTLDGAMGTMIQKYRLDYDGNNDMLCLTHGDVITAIHESYAAAGADILSTCTFNANAISMHDYNAEARCRDINERGAELARSVAERYRVNEGRRIYVAGSMGPTNKAASMSPDMKNPAMRNVTYDDLFDAYTTQIEGLMDGGVDILLFETVFDTINLKAGLDAAAHVMQSRGTEIAIMVSLTLASGGRSFSGQTLNAFLTSIAHSPYIASVGLNCSFGPKDMLPHLKELAKLAVESPFPYPLLISAHPNAGLPDEFGNYSETPESMAATIGEMLNERLVNIVGGCCGTTPEHIQRITTLAKAAEPHAPHHIEAPTTLRVCGLDTLDIKPENNFINVGERCNVAGSRKFLRLINEKKYDEAVGIARKQVEAGALVLDINLDDGMLDTTAEMTTFLNLLASEPEIAKVPLMIDSSDPRVVRQALKCAQGKSIVNSISLKEGEKRFLEEARMIHGMGAAMVVMAFDETGQATTFDRKIEICRRAYHLLTEKAGIPPTDIIFDPNILTIATGIEEHDSFAADYIRATAWIKQNLPGAKVSGGVSNLSFAFRGNNYLREAMHAVFLYHAIKAGLDMAILNPSTSVTYSDIEPSLRTLIEDVVLNRRKGAAEELAEYARLNNEKKSTETTEAVTDRTKIALSQRLTDALLHGNEEFLRDDLEEALKEYPSPMKIIEGPLLEGMNLVGELFGEGKMFLPQVVKTARTMNRAVEILRPTLDKERSDKERGECVGNGNAAGNSAGTVVIATVKGDVHDIGKNIVAIVLACNNFKVVDLGVMVPAETIVAKAKEVNADIICLSGLITPSLAEMRHVAEELQRQGMKTPLFVGGATTSLLHTALRIAPVYDGAVVHISDAARNPIVAAKIISAATRDSFISDLRKEYATIREEYESRNTTLLPLEEARKRNVRNDYVAPEPRIKGRQIIEIAVADVVPFINWKYFLNAWKMEGCANSGGNNTNDDGAYVASDDNEAEKLRRDAEELLLRLGGDGRCHIKGLVEIRGAYGEDENIIFDDGTTLPTPRQLHDKPECKALADYIAPKGAGDHIGLFAVTAGLEMEELYDSYSKNGDSYNALLLQTVSHRLAEAAAEWLHRTTRREIWGYAPNENLTVKEMWQNKHQGIRPAVGYPSLPDQLLMHTINSLLHLEEIGVEVTENGAMTPTATVSGLYIANPAADYFVLPK
jgi:5-methyltetrahydrofolate--homocysteine methyltransferase